MQHPRLLLVLSALSLSTIVTGCSPSALTSTFPAGPNTGGMTSLRFDSVRNPASPDGEKIIYRFKGLSSGDGANPVAGLIVANGTLFGTTELGGSDPLSCSEYVGCGSVFAVSTAGAEHVLYSFKNASDGANPYAGLMSLSGLLYGTTYQGGTDTDGTVFTVDPNSGSENVVYSFKGPGSNDGADPSAALIAVKGELYGTTSSGGVCDPHCGTGTVFEVSPSGTESVLHSFTGGGYYGNADGAYPNAGLTTMKGILYGTTADGGGTDCAEGSGSTGCGTTFEVNPSTGSESVVYSFKNNGEDGAYPMSSLLNFGGTLFGTTEGGGGHACNGDNGRGCGTVFSVNASGTEKILYSFKGASDGWGPLYSGLIAVKGMLYGTTENGGGSGCNSYGCGTVFKISPTGTGYKVIYRFKGGSDGANPFAGVIVQKGKLYGTTHQGGSSSCNAGCGTVFELTP